MSQSAGKVSQMSAKKRILNELTAKVRNEHSADQVTKLRKGTNASEYAEMTFVCECDRKDCPETISLSIQEYNHVHAKLMHFIVVPAHVQLDLEIVTETFPDYYVVEKLFPRPGTTQKKLIKESQEE